MFKIIKKIFLVLGVIFLLVLSITIYINIKVVNSTSEYILTIDEAQQKDIEVAIVLGAGVYSDGSLTPMLQDRMDYGIDLYKNGKVKKLLLTGDHGQVEYNEVSAMMNYAVEQGVLSDDIFLDHAGFSTYDSMYRAKEIFGVEKAIVITQDFHLARALYIGRELGVEVYGVASNPREYSSVQYNWIREYFARIKDYFMVIFDVEPTYLGESIPMSGSGEITH